MDLNLKGKAFLVTGGSRGLGYATAAVLLKEGAHVMISGRDRQVVESSVERLASERVAGVAADNASPDAAELLTQRTIQHFGQLDGVLISVGGPPASHIMETSDEAWRNAFESIFLGSIRLARVASAVMNHGGSVVFVLSTSVRSPIPELALSNGLRPGLAMAAKTLAEELGPQSIRVNGLLPGRILTDRMRDLGLHSSDDAGSHGDIPLKRFGRPEEFGRVAAFLLSDAAAYVTGTMLPVDGGLLRTI